VYTTFTRGGIVRKMSTLVRLVNAVVFLAACGSNGENGQEDPDVLSLDGLPNADGLDRGVQAMACA
jgi:hypothetical protein